MFQARPIVNGGHLARPRLLRRLPEDPGFIVWFQAPYGYGKSILASQWAQLLEAQGRRVIWLAVGDREVGQALAIALGLPEETSWSHLLDTLWRVPTLLVLEDLVESVTLAPLISVPGDLVLLASRKSLDDITRAGQEVKSRLVRLGAAELAFTKEEAEALAGGNLTSESLWEASDGWPLPLHYALLTGETPDQASLVHGVRSSLSNETWDEFLLLAALPHLPYEAASPETEQLVEGRFVHPLEGGYRLHPFFSEGVVHHYLHEARDAVRRRAGRLQPLLRGYAYEVLGMGEELSGILESGIELGSLLEGADAAAILRWDAAVSSRPRGPARARRVGYALIGMSRMLEGADVLERLAETVHAEDPNTALRAWGYSAYHLADIDHDRAMRSVQRGETIASKADALAAGVFYNNASKVFEEIHDLENAERALERACQHLTEANPMWLTPFVNLMKVRWERLGDLDGYIGALHQALPYIEKNAPYNYAEVQIELGRYKSLLGRTAEALLHFERAQVAADAYPEGALEAELEAAALRLDVKELAILNARAMALGMSRLSGRAVLLWAQTLRRLGEPASALKLLEDTPGFAAGLERSLNLADMGRKSAAIAGFPPFPQIRRERLLWWAARYILSSDESFLRLLLDGTLVGSRILPGLLPLSKLPPSMPELTAHYPLADVLTSKRKNAIELRKSELPPLEIKLLGSFSVKRMGQTVALTGRLRDLLTLIVMGESKDTAVSAIWSEASEERANNSFWVQHHALRRALEPWGVPTYLRDLELVHADVDVWKLERALNDADAATVYTLYRGSFAPGIELPVVEDRRAMLNARVTDLLYRAAEGSSLVDVEDYLRRVLALDPLNEPALQSLLKVLIHSGRRTSARLLLVGFVKKLQEETGLQPDIETLRLLM